MIRSLRSFLFFLLFLLISNSTFAQTTSTEVMTLQQLLTEVRQLRHDLQALSADVQMTQILLYRLQIQYTIVIRAQQKVDIAQGKLAQIRFDIQDLEQAIKKREDMKDSLSPAESKVTEQEISKFKTDLQALGQEEQRRQTDDLEAKDELRREQAKLNSLQDRLDRILSTLGDHRADRD